MRIAIIGCSGHYGMCVPKTYCEEREFAALAPGSQGENMEHVEQRLKNLGYAPRMYRDYREMLAAEKPDIAVVDNYYGEHGRVILDAFRAGCHVFAEKPAATSLAELDELVEAWKQAGTYFMAMFNYRYSGSFHRAWQLIREGAIGEVRLLNAQKSYKFGTRPDFMTHRETYGGTISWVGIHAIDWILWMSGRQVETVTALQSSVGCANGVCPEMTALAQFGLDNGVMASLTVDYFNPAKATRHGDDRIRVVGTKGVLEVRDNMVHLVNEEGVQQPENLPEEDIFTDFLNQCMGRGTALLSGEESFAATRAAILAQDAADR